MDERKRDSEETIPERKRMTTLRDRLAWTLKRDVLREINMAVKDEEAAVIMYSALADRLDKIGERRFAAKIHTIITDEKKHRSDLERLLKEMKRWFALTMPYTEQ